MSCPDPLLLRTIKLPCSRTTGADECSSGRSADDLSDALVQPRLADVPGAEHGQNMPNTDGAQPRHAAG